MTGGRGAKRERERERNAGFEGRMRGGRRNLKQKSNITGKRDGKTGRKCERGRERQS